MVMLVMIALNNFAAQLSSPVQSSVVIRWVCNMADYDEHERIFICLLLIGRVVKWLITVSSLLFNVEK